MTTLDLFAQYSAPPSVEAIAPGAHLLRRFALGRAAELLHSVAEIAAAAPFRKMETPGGFRMSVAMTNAGAFGWTTSRSGYRYVPRDPESGEPWPDMPRPFLEVAAAAASMAGFSPFTPDACLVNRYEPGAKMSLHQDRNEEDMSAPIVSVSLGLPATFLFGGQARSDKTTRVVLEHGDVVVWGREARLRFHGVLPVKEGSHPETGRFRYNLTFRKAG